MRRISLSLIIGVVLAGVGTIAVASRNSAGSYSLPVSPFVSGTSISSSSMNTQFADIATEISSSLDRSGRGGMSAPLRVPDGNAGAPTLAFTSDPSTGLYRIGTSNPAMSVAGTQRQAWSTSGTSVNGTCSVSGNSTVGGTLGVTGNASFATGFSTGNGVGPGDGIGRVQKVSSPTQGALDFGNDATHFVFWDGTRFTFGAAPDPVTTGSHTVTGTLGVSSNATVGGTLGVTGATTLASATVTGVATLTGGAALGAPITGMTRASLPAVGQQASASSGTFHTTSGSYVDVTNLSVTVVTSGRPVLIVVQPDGTQNNGTFSVSVASGASPAGSSIGVRILRDGVTTVAQTVLYPVVSVTAGNVGLNLSAPSSLTVIDVPTAASHTYKVQVLTNGTADVQYASLVAFEL